MLDTLHPQQEITISYPRKLARNHMITGLNQLWETDIKYATSKRRLFLFILSLIDVYDRFIINY
ncbi:hypothetical protein [Metabacillus fastidiosus]|uniref:hypothetical protein n=1 Tax=Metabacillus fastidiosus TaxID=1458 RepID=UPI002E1BD08D|nr:hypothetical protein [Metabacillus fastidiosus]